MAAAAVTRIVAQREDKDCAIAAMSMLSGRSYEDVLRAVVDHEPRFKGKRGLYDVTICAVLEALGTPVRKRRRVDYDQDYGLLRLEDHIVLLRRGLVVENEEIWPVEAWLKARRYNRPKGVTGVFVAVGS